MVKDVQSKRKNSSKWPGFVAIVLGILSFVASVVASGIDYQKWEASGELVCETPDWILWWHIISILLVFIGLAYVIWIAKKSKK